MLRFGCRADRRKAAIRLVLCAVAVSSVCRPAWARSVETLTDGWLFSRENGPWQTIRVPHDWGIDGPFDPDGDPSTGKLSWKGHGRYRRKLVVADRQEGERYFLDFDGVMARSTVFANGRPCGRGEYGYLGFRVDLTPYLVNGTNEIEVAADTIDLSSRWYPGGGIYRPVRLIRTTDIMLDDRTLAVTTPFVSATQAVVKVSALLVGFRNRATTCLAEACLLDPKGREVGRRTARQSLSPFGRKAVEFSFVVENPTLWRLERNAALYGIRVAVGDDRAKDEVSVRTGLRSFGFDPAAGFFLNGERVQLKGVNLHSDLGILGMAYDKSARRRQLGIMCEMGANAVRTSHNPVSPEALDLCDEMGIFVWNECFDKWEASTGRGDLPQEDFVDRQLEAFVRRDRNHPSVFVWSVGNEIPYAEPLPKGCDWKGMWCNAYGTTAERCWRAANVVRLIDSTRPVAIATCLPELVDRGDYAAFDVVGWNYAATYRHMHEVCPNVPLVYTESASAFSEVGCYPPWLATSKTNYVVSALATDSYDRTAACDLPDVEFARMEADRYVAGEFVWTGFDYLGEPCPYADSRRFGGIPNTKLPRSSSFGICDLTGFPKDRYWLYRSHWRRDAATVHLVPDRWTFPGREGQRQPVCVYTSGVEAELFVNGVSKGRRRKDLSIGLSDDYYRILNRYRIMWPDVRYEPGEIRVVAYDEDGRVVGMECHRTAGRPARIVLRSECAELHEGELVFVSVSLADCENTHVPARTDRISFTVRGPAEIVSVGNGNPRGYDSFKNVSSHPLFDGRASLAVRRTGAGRVQLKAHVVSNSPIDGGQLEWE